MSRRWERTWRELRPEVDNCFSRLRLRLRYNGWKIMMSIVASHDNSNPRQSRRDDESGHRRSRHNRFARMVLQLHNQTARPQLPQMIPRPHQSCRRRHLHLQLRQTMILPMLPWSQSQSRSCLLRQHLHLFVVTCRNNDHRHFRIRFPAIFLWRCSDAPASTSTSSLSSSSIRIVVVALQRPRHRSRRRGARSVTD